MAKADTTERFVQLLTEHQNRLYGYVYSLLGDRSRAADVVQETNLVLWRKIEEFNPEKPFLPWAFAVARFQVLAHLRDHKRDRMLLDAELVEELAGEVEQQAEQIEFVRSALRTCLRKLAETSRELVEKRYFETMAINEIAAMSGKTENAVKVALLRIRRQLAECVQNRIAAEN